MKKVRHRKSATWKNCNMEKVQHGESTKWEECNSKNVQHEKMQHGNSRSVARTP